MLFKRKKLSWVNCAISKSHGVIFLKFQKKKKERKLDRTVEETWKTGHHHLGNFENWDWWMNWRIFEAKSKDRSWKKVGNWNLRNSQPICSINGEERNGEENHMESLNDFCLHQASKFNSSHLNLPNQNDSFSCKQQPGRLLHHSFLPFEASIAEPLHVCDLDRFICGAAQCLPPSIQL